MSKIKNILRVIAIIYLVLVPINNACGIIVTDLSIYTQGLPGALLLVVTTFMPSTNKVKK